MNQPIATGELLQSARRTLAVERDAVDRLLGRLDDTFEAACHLILACTGRVVVTGIGKSGHIGNKIAATLASTGTPAFFVHPGEASHGDLGMITRGDVVIAISNSGEASEIVTIIPLIKRLGVPLIAMTGKPQSTMAKLADVNLDVSVEREACPLNLAPTASTTVTLAMGDALAVALLEARGFSSEDFAMSHPGGSLGKRLLTRVSDIMHAGDRIPRVTADTTISNALLEISQKGLGLTVVVDDNDRAIGVFTDGDLRRVLDQSLDIHLTTLDSVMTHGGKFITEQQLAVEAVPLFEKHKISALTVVDQDHTLRGVIHIHEVLRAGLI